MDKTTSEQWSRLKLAFKGEAQTEALPVSLTDQGQMFAGVATIRAAIADVLDAGWFQTADALQYHWHFNPNEEGDDETEARGRFMDMVVNRIAQLQSSPHDGIRLENLCDRHKRQVLPVPSAKVCGMCQVERVRGSASMPGGS